MQLQNQSNQLQYNTIVKHTLLLLGEADDDLPVVECTSEIQQQQQ